MNQVYQIPEIDCAGVSSAAFPPISVATQPGWILTLDMF